MLFVIDFNRRDLLGYKIETVENLWPRIRLVCGSPLQYIGDFAQTIIRNWHFIRDGVNGSGIDPTSFLPVQGAFDRTPRL